MTPTPLRRVFVMVLLAVLIAGVVAADRVVEDEATSVGTLPGADGPEATPISALSSSWYCPGGTANGGPLDASVTILNPTDAPMRGVVTVMSNEAKQAGRQVEVPPSGAVYLVVREILAAPWASVVVDLDGGGAVVDQTVGNPQDLETAPCSPSASRNWYFPSGNTQRDATLTLLLFNPFPDDAIVDLAFATGEGRRVPGDFVGIVVPPAAVVPVDIAAHVRRQDYVATEVKARSGRVVAGQALVRTGGGVAGVSFMTGAPSLGETWLFPDGLATDALAERLELFNPGADEARVDVELALDEGEVEPFEVTVPPQSRIHIDLRAEPRVPKGVAHAMLVQSVNGVPIAASRVIESAAPRVGRSDAMGARRLAREWGAPFAIASERWDSWVVVYNPTTDDATVSVTALAEGQRVAVEGLQGVNIPAGRRVPLRLTDHIKRVPLTLVVSASGEVVVERSNYGVGGPGLSTAMAIPLSRSDEAD